MWYTVLITLILDVGGLLLIYVLLRDRVRRAASSDAHIAEIRDEVSRLLVELNRTTDRNIALIEDRIASLNELLSSADKKIGLLRRETEKHDVGTQIYSRLAEGRSRVSGVQPPLSRPRRERDEPAQPPRELEETPQAGTEAGGVGEAGAMARGTPQPRQERDGVAGAAAAGRSGPPLAVELSDVPESRPGSSNQRESQGPDGAGAGTTSPRQERDQMPPGAAGGAAAAVKPPDLQQRVVMLHNAGFAASLIASRVGVPLGEVELIIALQERKGRA
jgi:hypothetical protein